MAPMQAPTIEPGDMPWVGRAGRPDLQRWTAVEKKARVLPETNYPGGHCQRQTAREALPETDYLVLEDNVGLGSWTVRTTHKGHEARLERGAGPIVRGSCEQPPEATCSAR